MYSSFFDCGERPDYCDGEIDWEWLIADASSPEERAALLRERDEERAKAEAQREYERWLDEDSARELAQERLDAQQWAPEEGDDIPF